MQNLDLNHASMVSSSSLTNYETSMASESLNGGGGSSTILSNGKMNSSHMPATSSNANGASTTGSSKTIFARNSFNTNGLIIVVLWEDRERKPRSI
jgi:hypothetical protein